MIVFLVLYFMAMELWGLPEMRSVSQSLSGCGDMQRPPFLYGCVDEPILSPSTSEGSKRTQ